MIKSAANTSHVRIIAGRWRGRKIQFATNLSIRPTPDRVRETVFNWLSPYLNNSRCLDLYAGSGVLGFEALSRGATEMVFVDVEKTVIKNLESQHQVLTSGSEAGKNNVDFNLSDAQAYLALETRKFDIVFLDPPYQKNMIPASMTLLLDKQLLTKNGLIYIEIKKSEILPDIPNEWQMLKSKVMAQVACYLLQVIE